jgi:hypothetical protein
MARSKATNVGGKTVAVVAGESEIIKLVKLAHEAKSELESAQIGYDALKVQLIAVARDRKGACDTIRLQAVDLEAVVAFGLDVEIDQSLVPQAVQELGRDARLYFEKRISYRARPALKDLLMGMGDADIRKALKGIATLEERAPRVTYEAIPQVTQPA